MTFPTQLNRDYFINPYKDLYETTRIQWKVVEFFFGSHFSLPKMDH